IQRQATQGSWPLAWFTGAIPLYCWFSAVPIAVTLRAKGSDQTGNQYIPGAWQGIEDGKIGVGLGELLNLSIVFPNRFVEGGERAHRGTRGRTAGGDNGEVGGGP